MMSINPVALERALKNTLDTHDLSNHDDVYLLDAGDLFEIATDLMSNIRKEEGRIHGTDGN